MSVVLKPVHYQRLRKIFELGRPIYVGTLSNIELDLLAHGLIGRLAGRDGNCEFGVKLALTDEGQIVLKRLLDARRAVADVHHSLGSRLAHWLRETNNRITWENATFSKDRMRVAQDGCDEWREVRVDVFSCALTPTARLSATETFEVKVSLADFRADLSKPLKIQASRDLAQAAWYCTPAGLVQPDMVPEGFGLLWEVMPSKFEVMKRPKRKKNFIPHIDTLMTLVLRRSTMPETAL